MVACGFLLALGSGALALALGPDGPPASVVATWSPTPPPTSTVSTKPKSVTTTLAPEPTAAPAEVLEPPPEAPPDPSDLPALTSAEQATPEAVAERFLVTYASFDPGADPAGLGTRLAGLTTPELLEELGRDSSASAALDDLRRRKVTFAGQVVDLTVSERSEARVSVDAAVEHTTAVAGVVEPDFRIAAYTLTLVRFGTGWLVAGLTQ